MNKIQVEQNPDAGRLAALGVMGSPIWSRRVSEFPWTYDSREPCYLLEEVTVTPDQREPVTITAGDLVGFPVGMSCQWRASRAVRKHYRFD